MTINNPDEFVNSLWNWACLDGCFGSTNIKVSDVDGEVERNSRFLRIETKGDNVPIPLGQQIMFQSLLNTGLWTIVVVWGRPQEPHKINLFTSKTVEPIVYENTNIDKFRYIVSKWFEWADNQTPAPKFNGISWAE